MRKEVTSTRFLDLSDSLGHGSINLALIVVLMLPNTPCKMSLGSAAAVKRST